MDNWQKIQPKSVINKISAMSDGDFEDVIVELVADFN